MACGTGHRRPHQIAGTTRGDDRNGEWSEEIQGDRHTERYAFEGGIEAQIHPGDGDTETDDAGQCRAVDAQQGPPQQQCDGAREGQTHTCRRGGADDLEQILGQARTQLDTDHSGEDEDGRGHRASRAWLNLHSRKLGVLSK